VMGTPQYMAPEQRDHPSDVDHRADIYSLGVVFYQMLTGELPGKQLEPPSSRMRGIVIDVRLDEVVLRALEKQPARRYQQASEVKTIVETIATTPPPSGAGVPTTAGKSSTEAMNAARRMVAAPATGLLVVGCLNLLLTGITVLLFLSVRATGSGQTAPHPAMVVSHVLLLPAILYFITTLLLITGTAQMRQLRNYGMAVTTCILAMITPPGLVVGLPFGIWALVVLERRQVRAAFEEAKPPGRQTWPRRKLIKVGSWLLGMACLIVLGAGLVCLAWPKSYRVESVVPVRGSPAVRAEAIQAALKGTAGQKFFSLEVREIGGANLIEITGSAKNPQAAADAVNAAVDRACASIKNRTGMTVQILKRTEPPATYARPNGAGIMGITLFFLMPPLAMPGIVLLIAGLLRRSDRTQNGKTPPSLQPVPPVMSAGSGAPGQGRSVGKMIVIICGALLLVGFVAVAVLISFFWFRKSVCQRDEQVHRQWVEVTERPQLRFLAWQDEWKTNQPGAARHLDGSSVTEAKELQWLRSVNSVVIDVSSLKLTPEPRFLHLWFSHPLFDRSSLNEVAFLDEAGKSIPLANGSVSSQARGANAFDNGFGWLTKTASPDFGNHLPAHVGVQLSYTLGPLEHTQDVQVKQSAYTWMALESGSRLSAVGQNVDGKAFVAIALDAEKMKSRKFGVMAVLKDGRELITGGGWSGNSDETGVRVEEFIFDIPLADVAKFIIGTRPIRTAEWKKVMLPMRSRVGRD